MNTQGLTTGTLISITYHEHSHVAIVDLISDKDNTPIRKCVRMVVARSIHYQSVQQNHKPHIRIFSNGLRVMTFRKINSNQ